MHAAQNAVCDTWRAIRLQLMNDPRDAKWRRLFGGLLVGGPLLAGMIVLGITGQFSALLLSTVIFFAPMLLGAWLLLRRPPD